MACIADERSFVQQLSYYLTVTVYWFLIRSFYGFLRFDVKVTSYYIPYIPGNALQMRRSGITVQARGAVGGPLPCLHSWARLGYID